jgi:pyridoxal phosphate enzyme (YggS family)
VNAGFPGLRDRIQAVREAISSAAKRSGRDAGTVRLIGVVKTVAADVVREAVALGLEDLGENRVQEAEAKIAAVGRKAARWHMIGHVQRNKAGRVAELFDWVHGVDSLALAQALARRAKSAARTLPVLVEVNVSGESSKFGVSPSDVEPLLEQLARLPGLELRGLMTVGRPVERADDARADFARLRELRDGAALRLGLELPELSMGMSGDYQVAVEEGATMVRVGTALFGPRE